MASITVKQADRLYTLVDELVADAETLRDEVLGRLNDPDVKADERAELTEQLTADFADLRLDWRRLGEFAHRLPVLDWPAATKGGR